MRKFKRSVAMAILASIVSPFGWGHAIAQEAVPDSPAPQSASPDVERESADEAKPVAVENGGRLDLICGGAGTANKPSMMTGYGNTTVHTPYGSAYGSTNTTIHGTRSQGFGDEVALFLEGGEGRIRMPRAMLPLLRGGEGGWFKLSNIRITQQEITASIKVNPLNNPKLRIDRYTGAISISGKAGDYAGRCQYFVPEQTQRQF